MATCAYNSSIKFILPTGFTMNSTVDDSGVEGKSIVFGDEEFVCAIGYVDAASDPEQYSQFNSYFQTGVDEGDSTTRYKLKGTPETVLRCAPIDHPFAFLLNVYVFEATVRVSKSSILKLVSARAVSEGEETDLFFSRCFEVLRAARIDGKSLPLNGLTGDTFFYEIMQNGANDASAELARVYPDQQLYPHYNSLLNAGGFLGASGMSMVVNSTGTEFEFIPLKRFLTDNDASDDTKALIGRILEKDTKKYDLHEKAKEMQKLFRVNREAFDTRHDRESELEDGLLHRAYMLSGLRSFAWTLSDYCSRENISPKDVSPEKLREIVGFIAEADWLNYDGDSHCKGLCSGSDLHVYFVPAGVAQADKKLLLPSKEDHARVKKMKEQFPSYREILSEVHSLDELRKDLNYIYPAVKRLWDYLAETRDHNKALIGNEADIVYAWCALALAAREPFFSEDGPMTCYFAPPIDEEAIHAEWQAKHDKMVADMARQWLDEHERYIEVNPDINFDGSIFVFVGVAGDEIIAEKEHPIVQEVIAKGGQYRTAVSGKTNYVVANPGYCGTSKVKACIEQMQKRDNIKLILLEDLEKALSEKATSAKKKSGSKTKNSSKQKNDLSNNISVDGGAWSVEIPANCSYRTDKTGAMNDTSGVPYFLHILTTHDADFTENYGSEISIAFRKMPLPQQIESLTSGLGAQLINDTATNPTKAALLGDCETITISDDIAVFVFGPTYDDNDDRKVYSVFIEIYVPKRDYFYLGQLRYITDDYDLFTRFYRRFVSSIRASSSDISNLTGELSEEFKKLDDMKKDMDKFGNFMEQKEAKEKADQEEKARKKAEAIASSSEEYDAVKMYIILTNEKKIGKTRRNQNDFYDIFGEDFPALTKTKLIALRKRILEEMKDKEKCKGYEAEFKKRSVKERYDISTHNLYGTYPDPDISVKSEFAIENTKEWYKASEYSKVRQLMDKDLADLKKQLDDQFDTVEPKWKRFSTARQFLRFAILDKAYDNSDVETGSSCFQLILDDIIINAELATQGIFSMAATVLDVMPWYWGVSVIDVWEAAYKNKARDARTYSYDSEETALRAINEIRDKYTSNKSIGTGSSPSKAFDSSTKSTSNKKKTTSQNNSSKSLKAAKTIDYRNFSDNKENITSVVIPEGVEVIDSFGFADCVNLRALSLPSSLRRIEEDAFYNCSSLTSIVIPDGVESIGDSAFCMCEKLKNVVLPRGLKTMGESVFGWTDIREITFPEGCIEIGEKCFQFCDNLKKIYIPSSVSKFGDLIFFFAWNAVVYTTRGSKAEKYAIENSMSVEYVSNYTAVSANRVTTNNSNARFSPSESEKLYSINYNLNGGQGSFPTQTKKHGLTQLIHQYQPTRTGYTFRGWGESANDQRVAYYPGSVYMLNQNITLYALWKSNTPSSTNNYSSPSPTAYKPAATSTPPQQSGGCYIATAVYGSYDAPEVMTLRRFRDETLQKTALGRLFIRTYYRLSPPIAEKLKYAKRINFFVRSILDRWVKHLNKINKKSR